MSAAYADKPIAQNSLAYAQTLNTMAALAMRWYGTQINDKTHIIAPITNSKLVGQTLSKQPNVVAISLSSAQIFNTSKGARFHLSGKLQYVKNQETYQQSFSNDLFFYNALPTQIEQIKTVLGTDVQGVTDGSTLASKEYYQSRYFAYAWLAFINGVAIGKKWINLDAWQDTSEYRLTMGPFSKSGKVLAMLALQRKKMGTGYYLLRQLHLDSNQANQGVIKLVFDFKGKRDGIDAIASFEQEIKYQVKQDGSWHIKYIKTVQILPNLQPWQNILC